MTYIGPDKQPMLLSYLDPEPKPFIFTAPINSVTDIVSKNKNLKKMMELINIANMYVRMAQSEYKSTFFAILDSSLDSDVVGTELATAINSVYALTLNKKVMFHDLLQCNGCILKTNNPRIDMHVEIDDGEVYIDSRLLVKSYDCKNGVLHILE